MRAFAPHFTCGGETRPNEYTDNVIYLYNIITSLTMELEWHAFFGAIKHEHSDELLSVLKSYDIGRYIVSREKSDGSHVETDGEHFHFMVEMTRQDYNRFAKRIFIDRFKLRGRATVGNPRQYGKVKNIENIELMQAYTVKDGSVITNLSEQELESIKEKSYKKENKRKLYDSVIRDLDEVGICDANFALKGIWFHDQKMIDSIIGTHIKEQIKQDVTKTLIERYMRLYILYHANIHDNYRLKWIKWHVWGSE